MELSHTHESLSEGRRSHSSNWCDSPVERSRGNGSQGSLSCQFLPVASTSATSSAKPPGPRSEASSLAKPMFFTVTDTVLDASDGQDSLRSERSN